MTTPPRRTRAASHYLNVKMAQVRQSIMILAKQRAQLEERDQITPKDLRDALGFLLPAPPN
ncbi:MAG: hypothetical protein MUF87_22450, partial [Anaerolineae bacterium]|nr:hypothetical protein [Anaerolineae bacterium]